MKKIVFLLFLISSISFSQEERDPSDTIKYFYLDGNSIEMPKVFNSSNDVFNAHFSEYKLHDYLLEKVNNKQGDYEIIYQKFSYEPLFLKGNLIEKDKKFLNKVIQTFKNKYRHKDLNIDNNRMIEYDIKAAIELGLVDSFFLKTLGKPNSTYKSSDGYKEYRYKGVEKSFDLIFDNGIVIDYRIFIGY